MKKFLLIFISIIISSSLAGCSTLLQERLSKLSAGMQKDQVLETAGNPNTSWRENGNTYWLYIYYVEELQHGKLIEFTNAKVATINEYDFGNSLESQALKANNFEEYKKRIKNRRKSSGDQFKSIDE